MHKNYRAVDISWLAAWALIPVLFVLGFFYLHWLDAGCDLNGIMTIAGKVCIN